jgi:hypothetical protein
MSVPAATSASTTGTVTSLRTPVTGTSTSRCVSQARTTEAESTRTAARSEVRVAYVQLSQATSNGQCHR